MFGELWSPSHGVGEKCWWWRVRSVGGTVNEDTSNLMGEMGESLMSPKRKQFPGGEGEGKILITPPWNCASLGLSWD